MEDAHIAVAGSLRIDGKSIPYELFSIIDGHGGSLTAQFIAAHMQQELEKALAKHGLSDSGVQRALKEAFLQLDAQAIRSVQEESGAVAVATLKIGSIIWTANLGDCRAILKVGEEVIQLSEDAKPDNPRFKKSIEKRGGLVINVWGVPRVNGDLAVARAFNDHRILGKKGYYAISARPKITKFDLSKYPRKPITLIQACDGVWDVGSSKDVASIATHSARSNSAAAIVAAALNGGSFDNCSVLVTPLHTA